MNWAPCHPWPTRLAGVNMFPVNTPVLTNSSRVPAESVVSRSACESPLRSVTIGSRDALQSDPTWTRGAKVGIPPVHPVFR